MGTPQVARFTAHGAEHELVFTGVAPRLDLERIARDVQKICETQIAFSNRAHGARPSWTAPTAMSS